MKTRPLLQCVNYNKNGSFYATDSHVLVKVADFHEHSTEFNLNLSTMEVNENFYPDWERLVTFKDITTEIAVDIDLLTKALKTFNDKSLLNNVIDMDIKDKIMSLTSQSLPDFKIEIPLHDCEGEIKIAFQTDYLINGLAFIKDEKVIKRDLTNKFTLIQFQSIIKPFKLVAEDKYEYLITPVRNFN
ncbi:hypothetical protein [Carnobacterium sp. TMP28]|uniref:hypothetical protein n=1 Tax=Carnobacterium sp. TMP28 TaxID=3397060 RepID=UPI0039E1E884